MDKEKKRLLCLSITVVLMVVYILSLVYIQGGFYSALNFAFFLLLLFLFCVVMVGGE